MFDSRRYVGGLRQAETDQLSPGIARGQFGANTAVELLVESDLVPRTVDSGDDRRRVQALEAGAVELDRRGVGRQRRAQVGAGAGWSIFAASSLRSLPEIRSPAMQLVQGRRIETQQLDRLRIGCRLLHRDAASQHVGSDSSRRQRGPTSLRSELLGPDERRPELEPKVVRNSERGLITRAQLERRGVPERQQREHHGDRDQRGRGDRPERLGGGFGQRQLRERPAPWAGGGRGAQCERHNSYHHCCEGYRSKDGHCHQRGIDHAVQRASRYRSSTNQHHQHPQRCNAGNITGNRPAIAMQRQNIIEAERDQDQQPHRSADFEQPTNLVTIDRPSQDAPTTETGAMAEPSTERHSDCRSEDRPADDR